MKLATGVDLIEIERVQTVVARYGERFLQRIFTPAERSESGANIASLAARFAAKEAVSKALSTGIGRITWHEIEIRRGDAGNPVLILHGTARLIAQNQGLTSWSLSLSHSREHAIAVVVAVGFS